MAGCVHWNWTHSCASYRISPSPTHHIPSAPGILHKGGGDGVGSKAASACAGLSRLFDRRLASVAAVDAVVVEHDDDDRQLVPGPRDDKVMGTSEKERC